MYSERDLPQFAYLRACWDEGGNSADASADAAGEGAEAAQKLRKQHRQTMRMASRLLADKLRRKRCHLLVLVVKPIMTAHKRENKALRGPEGVEQYAIAWASGVYKFVCQQSFAILVSKSSLEALGFHLCGSSFGCSAPSGPSSISSGRPLTKSAQRELNREVDRHRHVELVCELGQVPLHVALALEVGLARALRPPS